MVEFLDNHFKEYGEYEDLDIVSDGICSNNSEKYLNFDKFIELLFQKDCFKGDMFSSPDTVLINLQENHIVFVEFKDMSYFENEEEVKEWWKTKKMSIYLKMTDSIVSLGYYLNHEFDIKYDEFMNTSKSFIYVYKANTYKEKIHRHLDNKLARYDFLFKNIKTIETEKFKSFLEIINR